MALSDLQVFQEEAYGAMVETLHININLFNSATGGSLILAPAVHQGDLSTDTFWKRTEGLVRERDPYKKDGAVPSKELSMGTRTSVRYASGTPEMRMDATWMNWIQRSPIEAGIIFGRQLAEQRLRDQLYTALGIYVGAMKLQTNMVYDHAAAVGAENNGKACLQAMLRGQAKFGDQSSLVNCWVMTSKSQVDIYEQTMANAEKLFVFGNIIVNADAQGRPIIATDADPLFFAGVDGVEGGTDDRYYLCGLTNSAVVLEPNNDWNEASNKVTGNENIKSTYQAEWSEQVGLKGFTWDDANGGKNPTRAKLQTGTNWDKVVEDDKALAGCLVITK